MNHFSGNVNVDLASQFGSVIDGGYPATVSNSSSISTGVIAIPSDFYKDIMARFLDS